MYSVRCAIRRTELNLFNINCERDERRICNLVTCSFCQLKPVSHSQFPELFPGAAIAVKLPPPPIQSKSKTETCTSS